MLERFRVWGNSQQKLIKCIAGRYARKASLDALLIELPLVWGTLIILLSHLQFVYILLFGVIEK